MTKNQSGEKKCASISTGNKSQNGLHGVNLVIQTAFCVSAQWKRTEVLVARIRSEWDREIAGELE